MTRNPDLRLSTRPHLPCPRCAEEIERLRTRAKIAEELAAQYAAERDQLRAAA